MTTKVAPTISRPNPLTAKDRCDACTARAVHRVWLPSGRHLVFCGHHYALHAKALKTQGAVLEEGSQSG